MGWGDSGPIASQVERLAATMFAPVTRSHRITVDQMAMLEPALSETLTNGCISLIHDGLQRVIDAGVPKEAAEDFLMGHFQIGIAIDFPTAELEAFGGCSDGPGEGTCRPFQRRLVRIFERDAIMESVRAITGGD